MIIVTVWRNRTKVHLISTKFQLISSWMYALKLDKDKPEARWSCIAHLSAEDMLKLGVIEEKKFKNIVLMYSF